MRKFIVLSILAAIAGITVGIVRRQPPATTTVAVAAEITSTTTTVPATSTTVPTAKTVGTAKVTSTTRPKIAAPVVATSTTRPAQLATTTTTTKPISSTASTTVAIARAAPTCVIVPATTSLNVGQQQILRLTSNMPQTNVTMKLTEPAPPNAYPNTFVNRLVTDDAGSSTWSFRSDAWTAGAVRVTVSFTPTGSSTVENVCGTSYQSKGL